jgi:heme-degrading monooxygenase HmoA
MVGSLPDRCATAMGDESIPPPAAQGRALHRDRLRSGARSPAGPADHCQARPRMKRNNHNDSGDRAMILEVADIRIQTGKQAEFDEAIMRGIKTVVSKSKGFLGYKVNKSIETPERYILLIVWETLQNHTVDFRQSPAFTAWRAIVGPFFASPPFVEHFTLVGEHVPA